MMKVYIKAIYIASKKYKLNLKTKLNDFYSEHKEIKLIFGNSFRFTIVYEDKHRYSVITVLSIANIASKKIKLKKETLEGYKNIL